MSKRDGYTPEQREHERTATRERMARLRADPAYRDKVNTRRRERDRERKQVDPTLRPRLTQNSLRHHHSHKGDPGYQPRRADYLRRWRTERRIGEEFEAFMARVGSP